MRTEVKSKIKNIAIGLFCFTSIIAGVAGPVYINNDTSRVHFIDTGNSDCILIEDEKNILIDGGDNGDGMRVLEYLAKYKIKEIQ